MSAITLGSAQDFWEWFSLNNSKYLFLNEMSVDEKDAVMDELLAKLHEYCDQLFFEIGGHPDDERVELIITAEGVEEYFPAVETLVEAAPVLPRWTFIKFRQPHGKGFVTEYQGRSFDPDKIIYIPLYSEEHPGGVGLQVCYPDYTEEEHAVFVNGTFITIDSLVGERSSVEDIDFIDVIKTPEDINEEEYPVLTSLIDFIHEKKVLKYPPERFTVLDLEDAEGYLVFFTINTGYVNYPFKEQFPWFLKITLTPASYNENGHPEDEEAEVLNEIEDVFEQRLKALCGVQYIGRTTLYKKREIYYYLSTGDEVKAMLQYLQENEELNRHFDFMLEEDPSWTHVVPYLSLATDENEG